MQKGRWGKSDCTQDLITLDINGTDSVVGAKDGTV